MTTLAPAVAAGHPATAEVGRQVLLAGGNAADAAAAMVLAGCVAETLFTGLGGGGFATVLDGRTGEVHCLDFFVAVPGLDGTVPAPARTIDVRFGGVAVPYAIGGPSVAVPGTPQGVAELHGRFGRLEWSDIVRPARDLAELGSPFPEQHAELLPDVAAAMVVGAGVTAYSRTGPDGLPRHLRAGELLHHEGLAATLDAYLHEGPALWTEGPYGRRLVDAVRVDGGALSTADLQAYRVRDLPAERVPFAGRWIRVRGDDLDAFGATAVALDVEAVRAGGAARVLALVEALRAPTARSETTSLVAVDADGSACVVTHSLGLGSGVWSDGVHGNSMLGEGELLRRTAAPGERMPSMMVPLVVTDDDGRAVLVGGAAGGSRIRSSLLQVLAGVLVQGRGAAAAVAAPRLAVLDETVHLEPGFEPEVEVALRAAGHPVVRWAQSRPFFGGVAVVAADGPAADPRRGGVAVPLG
ncbi:gamma-glutamyltransferase [Nakamurella leprariae]|uniref:Gamma-glutamyltransferase n=1 Tax=Nakamurella leprariae TaxID=2803911 RepID=A0A938YF92_9ACTN|nr:gamma-glutamyltransferase [Nakamurella leprariae]MBM9466760.1 gamma-glutamyltransferase [Nakamurella leprariae]